MPPPRRNDDLARVSGVQSKFNRHAFLREFGFTLAEMMVVMLIMSIIMAAMAPIMTTRMKNDNSSPWKWCENKVDAYFGNSDRQIAMIGQRTVGTNESNAKLIIKTNNDRPNHILFKRGNAIAGQLRLQNGAILLGSLADGTTQANNTVAIGQNVMADTDGSVVIGRGAANGGGAGVAIGQNARVAIGGIAIGNNAAGGVGVMIGNGASAGGQNLVIGNNAHKTGNVAATTIVGINSSTNSGHSSILGDGITHNGDNAVVIGEGLKTSSSYSVIIVPGAREIEGGQNVVIGYGATSSKYNSENDITSSGSHVVAIGRSAQATGMYSTAIGYTTQANGNYSVAIGYNAIAESDYHISLGTASHTTDIQGNLKVAGVTVTPSDRRLKYVGSEFTSGLDKIRALKPYNYIFKKDEAKTPRVGVMAQDLQKIFPNAVKIGADGFLTIRMEDMFYALINAVKELDSKVTALTNEIKELRKENKEIKQRLKALEAK